MSFSALAVQFRVPHIVHWHSLGVMNSCLSVHCFVERNNNVFIKGTAPKKMKTNLSSTRTRAD